MFENAEQMTAYAHQLAEDVFGSPSLESATRLVEIEVAYWEGVSSTNVNRLKGLLDLSCSDAQEILDAALNGEPQEEGDDAPVDDEEGPEETEEEQGGDDCSVTSETFVLQKSHPPYEAWTDLAIYDDEAMAVDAMATERLREGIHSFLPWPKWRVVRRTDVLIA